MAEIDPLIRAVEAEIIAHEEELRRTHETTPDDWRAVRIDQYPGGADAIALLPPDDVAIADVEVVAGDAQPTPGEPMVPALVHEVDDEIEVDYTETDGERDAVELWVENPPANRSS